MWPIAATVVAAVGMVAGAAAAVHTGTVPPGIVNALQHVPTDTHAHAVLEALQQAFASGTHPSATHHPGQ